MAAIKVGAGVEEATAARARSRTSPRRVAGAGWCTYVRIAAIVYLFSLRDLYYWTKYRGSRL
jgi:hypothetical protein